jgi:hypothetical protein
VSTLVNCTFAAAFDVPRDHHGTEVGQHFGDGCADAVDVSKVAFQEKLTSSRQPNPSDVLTGWKQPALHVVVASDCAPLPGFARYRPLARSLRPSTFVDGVLRATADHRECERQTENGEATPRMRGDLAVVAHSSVSAMPETTVKPCGAAMDSSIIWIDRPPDTEADPLRWAISLN